MTTDDVHLLLVGKSQPRHEADLGGQYLKAYAERSFGGDGFSAIVVTGHTWDGEQRSGSGTVIPVSFATIERAREVAAAIFEMLAVDFPAMVEADEARHREYERRHEERMERERPAREAAAAKRQAEVDAITDETPRDVRLVCSECGHDAEPREFEESLWECPSCGREERGEDGRRCSECNKFCSKTATSCCPSCNAADSGEERQGVVLSDGSWIPDPTEEES